MKYFFYFSSCWNKEERKDNIKFFAGFRLRLCLDDLLEALQFGERCHLAKLEQIGRRFHTIIDGYLGKLPLLVFKGLTFQFFPSDTHFDRVILPDGSVCENYRWEDYWAKCWNEYRAQAVSRGISSEELESEFELAYEFEVEREFEFVMFSTIIIIVKKHQTDDRRGDSIWYNLPLPLLPLGYVFLRSIRFDISFFPN